MNTLTRFTSIATLLSASACMQAASTEDLCADALAHAEECGVAADPSCTSETAVTVLDQSCDELTEKRAIRMKAGETLTFSHSAGRRGFRYSFPRSGSISGSSVNCPMTQVTLTAGNRTTVTGTFTGGAQRNCEVALKNAGAATSVDYTWIQ